MAFFYHLHHYGHLMKNPPEIPPEEIRAIRKQLRLSQVEAGKIIGGGPRAFTKYEAGTVRPAASLIGLLRVLQTDPTLLAALQGNKPQSIASGVVSPFDITGNEIANLTEKTFPRLLRRLLHAEAQAHDLTADGIHVASNVYAPDGGEDGRMRWEHGPPRTPFLPTRLCQFQLKAGRITPSAAAQDVLDKNGNVKVMVRKVLEATGNYIMLCARPHTQKQIADREASIRNAIRRAGMEVEVGQVDFRDADQIAEWVNCHPAVATWVKEQTTSITVRPFHSWSHWAGRTEHEQSPWVEDERLPAIRAYLHERIKEPRCFVRIVGPAGVGKSRLTLKALGSAIEDDEADRNLSDIVLYTVQSEARGKDIIKVIQDLADLGQRAVVVVDQCEPQTHRILVDIVSRQSSRLSLITIDDEIPTGTLSEETFKVDEAPASVTEAIIKHVSPGLPSEDERRLVSFSKGFPKIAVQIGHAWISSIPIAHATDFDLVETFVLGRRSKNPQLLLKSAMLVAVFGLIEAETVKGDLRKIARLCRKLYAEDLYAAVRVLVERGAARRRGRLVALQPRPISLSLAERQWKEWDQTKWDQVLTGDINPRLRVLAARQLALLNTTEVSQIIVKHVCRRAGPLEGFEALSKAGNAETLSALAAIHPEVVSDLIKRSLDDANGLPRVTAEVRRHILYALAKICFHAKTFEEGACLLLRIASAENEQWANSATGQFVKLFPTLLGQTEADGNARLSFLKEAISGDGEPQRLIAAKGLLAGSKTRDFTRFIGGSETQGTRPALESWKPAPENEAIDYIQGCVSLLAGLAMKDDKVGVTAQEGLGQKLRSLIRVGLIELVEKVVAQVGAAVCYWPKAATSLRNVLFFDTEYIGDDVTNRVERLFTDLEPKSLHSRIRVHVTEESWIFLRDKDSDYKSRYRARVKAVRELAEELLEASEALSRAFPDLSKGNHRMAGELGVALAELADSPLQWLEPITQAILKTPEDERNFDLLTGFVGGLAKDHPEAVANFKECAGRLQDLAPALPQVCFRLGITASDIKLVIRALQTDVLPPRALNIWSFGGVLAKVPASEVAPLFDSMLDHGAEGFKVAINLMGMYAYDQPEKSEELLPQILKLVENLAKWQDPPIRDLDIHHFEKIVGWMLDKGRQEADATATAFSLAKTLVDSTEFRGDRIIKPLLSRLLSNFPEVTWQLIGHAIVSDDQKAALLTSVLGDRFSMEANPLILSLPKNALFAWFYAHPDRAPAFTARILPVLESYKVDTSKPSLHPVTERLLDEFGEREDVQRGVESNIHTFSWSGSVTTYYALHKEPFSKLRQHPKPKVRSWAKVVLRQINNSIERARRRDEESEAQLEY